MFDTVGVRMSFFCSKYITKRTERRDLLKKQKIKLQFLNDTATMSVNKAATELQTTEKA